MPIIKLNLHGNEHVRQLDERFGLDFRSKQSHRITVILKQIVIGNVKSIRNLFGNRQNISEGFVRELMEFHGMLFWNDQSMAPANRLNVQECITISVSARPLPTVHLFAVSIILNEGISPLTIRQKTQEDMIEIR